MVSYTDWYSTTQEIPHVLVEKKNFLSFEDVYKLQTFFRKNHREGEENLRPPAAMEDKIFRKIKDIASQYGIDVEPDMMVISNTRNGQGHEYHMDNCKYDFLRNVIPNHTPNRLVSMSVSLTQMNKYKGGELSFQTSEGVKAYKIPIGDAVMFTSTHKNPHWVNKVTEGERLVLLVWMKSNKQRYESNLMKISDTPSCVLPLTCISIVIIVVIAMVLYFSLKKKPVSK